jgi:hypothetical protein
MSNEEVFWLRKEIKKAKKEAPEFDLGDPNEH